MILLRAGLGPFSLSLPLWTGLGPWSFFSLSPPLPRNWSHVSAGEGLNGAINQWAAGLGPWLFPPRYLFCRPENDRQQLLRSSRTDRPTVSAAIPPLAASAAPPARALPSALVCHPSRSGGQRLRQRSQRRIPFVLRRTCAIGVARKHTMPRALPAAEGAKVAGPTSNADPPLTSLGLPHQS